MNPSTCSWPRESRKSDFGWAYTVQHSVYKNKARWAVWHEGKARYEHILVWEKFHGRKLPKGWVVHHIDEDPMNNSIENLQAMTSAAHNSLHKLRVMNSHRLTPNGEEGKCCGECGLIKPLSDFARNGTSAAGTPVYRPKCKECGRP